MLNVNSSTPLYMQLVEDIQEKIAAGSYCAGARLPSGKELTQMYGVSIITVRKAIDKLQEDGIIERKQGKGTFVAKPKMRRGDQKFAGFSEICIGQGVRPGGKMLNNELVKLDDRTSESLKQPVGSQGIYLRRLRFADGEPVAIEKMYFPIRYAFLLDKKFDDESLFLFLKQEEGIVIKKAEKTIELCQATPEEGKLLHVSKGYPLLLLKSIAYLKDDSILYTEHQIINADRFIYQFTQTGME